MKTVITYDEFAKLDLRVGQVVKAEVLEWSEKLLKFEVDLGSDIGTRVIFSGIKKWYEPKSMVGKKYIFLVNMETKRMGSEESQGMMIMADTRDGNPGDIEKPILIEVPESVETGVIVR